MKLVKESSRFYKKRRVGSPEDSYKLFQDYIGEVYSCLDTKNQLTNISTVHIGSLNSSIVHPREVMKTAILSNSYSILICHSHPSGDPTPSPEDIDVIERLAEAFKIV